MTFFNLILEILKHPFLHKKPAVLILVIILMIFVLILFLIDPNTLGFNFQIKGGK